MPVEAGEALDQRRRNNQDRIGIVERVANEQTRPVLDRRRHKIQIAAQVSHNNGCTYFSRFSGPYSASSRSAHSGSAGWVRSVPGMMRMSPCIAP